MDYFGLGTLFRIIAEKAGPYAALYVLGAVVFVVLCVKSSRTVWASLDRWVQSLIDERKGTLQELKEARVQNATFINNHLEHDRDEREKLITTLMDISAAMKSIDENVEEHREEAKKRASALHQKLDAYRVEVIKKGLA